MHNMSVQRTLSVYTRCQLFQIWVSDGSRSFCIILQLFLFATRTVCLFHTCSIDVTCMEISFDYILFCPCCSIVISAVVLCVQFCCSIMPVSVSLTTWIIKRVFIVALFSRLWNSEDRNARLVEVGVYLCSLLVLKCAVCLLISLCRFCLQRMFFNGKRFFAVNQWNHGVTCVLLRLRLRLFMVITTVWSGGDISLRARFWLLST